MNRMETNNIDPLSCRACMQFTNTMYSLFDEYEGGISMVSLLYAYLNTDIKYDVRLPNELCEDCVVTMVKFHNFSVVFRAAQMKLSALACVFDGSSICVNNDYKEEENESILKTDLIASDNENNVNLHAGVSVIEDLNYDDCDWQYTEELDTCADDNVPEDAETETIKISFEGQDLDHTQYELDPANETSDYINVADVKIENVTQFNCAYCDDVFLYLDMFKAHVYKAHHISVDLQDGSTSSTIVERRIFSDKEAQTFSMPPKSTTTFGVYNCKICKKQFLTVKSLHLHESSHARNNDYNCEEKKYICDVCGRAFKKKSYLNDHVEIHDGVRKLHNCPICGKNFKGRSNFARHKRYHSRDKRCFICEKCGIGFSLVSTLKTHYYLKHVKERTLQCLICAQYFALKSTLEKHVKRHQRREGSATAVTYACPDCDMRYLDKSSLKRHIELKHSDVHATYDCADCDKQYTTFTNLSKHRRKKHPDRPMNVARKRLEVMDEGVNMWL